MALNGWLSKCPVSIQGSRLATTVTNFPMLMVASNFPSDIFLASGGCHITGRDIRLCTDVDGVNELPREIIAIDKTTSILSIYVKVPTITAGVVTTIYCFWNNANADEPGNGSASQNLLVWNDFYGVCHFNTMTTAWKGIKDVSNKWNSMTAIGTPLAVVGHASGLTAASLSVTFGLTLHEYINWTGNTMDLMFWCYLPTAVVGNIATGTNGIAWGWLTAGQWGISWGLTATTGGAVGTGAWHLVYMRSVAGVCNIYVDGVNKTSGTGTSGGNNFNTFGLGATGAPAWYLSEFRMTRGNNTSIDNIQGMYACESNPALFSTSGAVVTVSESYALTISGLHIGSEVRIYNSSDMSELAGIEATVGTTFTWNFSYTSSYNVDIVILHLEYQFLRMNGIAITAGDMTIPIQQQYDRNYNNPA